MSRGVRGPLAALMAIGLAAVLGACTSGVYADTVLPTATPAPSSSSTSTPPFDCGDPVKSYDPVPSLTSAPAQAAIADIKKRGYLLAGVSGDSRLLGSRNPLTGQIEGFDIDMVHAVAEAIFGDANKVTFIVISAANRTKVLMDQKVDIVVRNMTMSCDRWRDIAFSSQYYRSGLKILVRTNDKTNTLEGLAGKRVCAPKGTSTLTKVSSTAGVIAVGADTHTGCLVLFQNGEVDAIAGDDTVLAGLVAQDPYAYVPPMQPLTDEPYGIGVNKDKVDFVRYVNKVVDTVKADGRWKASYDKWFLPNLKVEATPPASTYGRT